MDARMRNLVSKALMVDAQPVLQAGSPAQGAVALDIYDEMLPTYGKDRRYRIAYAVAPALADRPRLAAINGVATVQRSEEHTSELQSLMRISYAVFCLKKKTKRTQTLSKQLHIK